MTYVNRKRVLVTGASGFIGAKLAERLYQDGIEVFGVSREAGTRSNIPAQNLIACDLTDHEAVAQVMEEIRPQVVIHLASSPDAAESHAHSANAIAGNLTATVNLLEAFGRHKGSVFVYGDSCKSYGNIAVPYTPVSVERPNSSYAITKSAAWSFCRLYADLYQFASVAIRPTLIYGAGQGFNLFSYLHRGVREGRSSITLMGGRQTRDPLYIDDAVAAYVAAVNPELDQQVITIGGGAERPVHEIAEKFVTLLDPQCRVVCSDSEIRSTEIMRSYSDNSRARTLLGWTPEVELTDGLRLTIDYLDAQPP